MYFKTFLFISRMFPVLIKITKFVVNTVPTMSLGYSGHFMISVNSIPFAMTNSKFSIFLEIWQVMTSDASKMLF